MGAILHVRGRHSPGTHARLQGLSARHVLVGDNDAQRVHSKRRRRRGARPGQRHGEPESAPAARLTLDADLAAHELDELFADAEPETRAAVHPRHRAISLSERPEQLPARHLGDPDARVGDLKS